MKNLEKRIKAIEDRNAKVEQDKAWETSLLRRGLITLLTYIIAACYMSAIDIDSPLLNAAIPAGGYFLSTLVMQSAKNWWSNR